MVKHNVFWLFLILKTKPKLSVQLRRMLKKRQNVPQNHGSKKSDTTLVSFSFWERILMRRFLKQGIETVSLSLKLQDSFWIGACFQCNRKLQVSDTCLWNVRDLASLHSSTWLAWFLLLLLYYFFFYLFRKTQRLWEWKKVPLFGPRKHILCGGRQSLRAHMSLFSEKLQLSLQFLSGDPILRQIFICKSQLFPSCSVLIGLPTVIKKTLFYS